jgi:5-deoxy-glucuronate isomerase
VYAPRDATVDIVANRNGTEIAVAAGLCETEYAPFRIPPQEIETVEVGSSATKSHRRICHILGHNGRGRAGNLLVSELYAEEGCWSGYPPHKHDRDDGEEESAFEEIYHFRFRPETGFGAQIVYQPDGSAVCYMTRNGDTVIIDRGYHPAVTSPGHAEYILTILVGKNRRSLIQNFQEEHRHLLNDIPGIAEMRQKFK